MSLLSKLHWWSSSFLKWPSSATAFRDSLASPTKELWILQWLSVELSFFPLRWSMLFLRLSPASTNSSQKDQLNSSHLLFTKGSCLWLWSSPSLLCSSLCASTSWLWAILMISSTRFLLLLSRGREMMDARLRSDSQGNSLLNLIPTMQCLILAAKGRRRESSLTVIQRKSIGSPLSFKSAWVFTLSFKL